MTNFGSIGRFLDISLWEGEVARSRKSAWGLEGARKLFKKVSHGQALEGTRGEHERGKPLFSLTLGMGKSLALYRLITNGCIHSLP